MGQLNAYLETLLSGTTYCPDGIWSPGSYSTKKIAGVKKLIVRLCSREKDCLFIVSEASVRRMWASVDDAGFLYGNTKALYVLSMLMHGGYE